MMMNTEFVKIFKLFSTCIPVRGYKRSIIYDLHRCKSETIPLGLFGILHHTDTNIDDILFKYGKQNIKIINEYFAWLIKHQYGFFCYSLIEARCFPKLKLTWDMPHKVTNTIIEIIDTNDLIKVLNTIVNADIPHVQIIIRNSIDAVCLLDIGRFFATTTTKTVDIISSFSENSISISEIKNICELQLRFSSVILYNSPFNKKIELLQGLTNIFHTTKSLNEDDWCGFVSKNYFSINTMFFTESQHHNTCLNRKLCIDKDGYIKNCPSMKHHYGHISDTNIEDIVQLPEFQKWWHIKKDDIDVCKDCEFRHMCTDCRAFIKDPENIYSQPAKCPYNPYICKWEGEEGYVPVEECGTYTRETGFVPNKRKINKLNKQIWGE